MHHVKTAVFLLISVQTLTGASVPESAIGSRLMAGRSSVARNLSFEPNVGQAAPEMKFLARWSGYSLSLTSTGAVFADGAVRMRLEGANRPLQVVGVEEQPGKVNYLRGNDPKQWRTNVATYGKVMYRAVYAGIDLIFHGSRQQIEYDFIVAPRANPNAIRIRLESAHGPSVDSRGDLVVGDQIRFRKPVVYQEVDGVRMEVSGSYVLHGKRRIGFRLGAYDKTKPLVIDPVVVFSKELVQRDQLYNGVSGIAVDAANNSYVTGWIGSDHIGLPPNPVRFPEGSSLSGSLNGYCAAYVRKLDPTGSTFLYSTYLGGSAGCDQGRSIAVDAAGNAYVTGWSDSPDFPTTADAFQRVPGGRPGVGRTPDWDAFVAKLDSTGALVYSTYVGGVGYDGGNGIAVDGAGNAYVTGGTSSVDFPIANTAQSQLRARDCNPPDYVTCSDAFVAKLNPAGSALVYSTYLGGAGTDVGWGIGVDAAGNTIVAGLTYSIDFPTKDAQQSSLGEGVCPANTPCEDAFVTKLDAGGRIVYSTYLGGSRLDAAYSIAVDPGGSAFLAGITYSSDFPLVKPLQPAQGGGVCWGAPCPDAFVAKLNPSGELVYSTYLGGIGSDGANGIAVDAAGNILVTGSTSSNDFPTANPLQASRIGATDGFVARLNAAGSSLLFATYMGDCPEPSCDRWASWTGATAVDGSGSLYVAGGISDLSDQWSFGSSFVVKIDLTGRPALATNGVVSAGSLLPGPVAPGDSLPIELTVGGVGSQPPE